MFFKAKRSFLFLLLALVFLSQCSYEQKPDDQLSVDPQKLAEEKEAARLKSELEAARLKIILGYINERNKTLKKSPEWLKEAYSGLKIRKLNEIPKEEYNKYSAFVSSREIYIIVHPGYYAFFDDKTLLPSDNGKELFPSKTFIERLAGVLPANKISIKVMLGQERLLRNFIELMSADQRLVILVLPRDYKNHLSHGFTPGLDEYARYINEMSNMSESTIYMESQSYDSGYLTTDDLAMLRDFLKEINVKTISYGGGYIGKCLGEFSTSLMYKFKYNNVFFIPELASISPFEIDDASHTYLMTDDGRISARGVVKYYRDYGFKSVMMQKSKSIVKRLKFSKQLQEDADLKEDAQME